MYTYIAFAGKTAIRDDQIFIKLLKILKFHFFSKNDIADI